MEGSIWSDGNSDTGGDLSTDESGDQPLALMFCGEIEEHPAVSSLLDDFGESDTEPGIAHEIQQQQPQQLFVDDFGESDTEPGVAEEIQPQQLLTQRSTSREAAASSVEVQQHQQMEEEEELKVSPDSTEGRLYARCTDRSFHRNLQRTLRRWACQIWIFVYLSGRPLTCEEVLRMIPPPALPSGFLGDPLKPIDRLWDLVRSHGDLFGRCYRDPPRDQTLPKKKRKRGPTRIFLGIGVRMRDGRGSPEGEELHQAQSRIAESQNLITRDRLLEIFGYYDRTPSLWEGLHGSLKRATQEDRLPELRRILKDEPRRLTAPLQSDPPLVTESLPPVRPRSARIAAAAAASEDRGTNEDNRDAKKHRSMAETNSAAGSSSSSAAASSVGIREGDVNGQRDT
uniref:Uncharacterized protein n=1 Tax=Chromera velia CCMP2878 TaxID=1169474 RepID=A0A0G4FWK8_9ALVE|eukprot:Cvel_19106.t1-p1 / transcript=Cvel_19106.t1 / gene=Cvel_19106 / organism=Chromera_velia_CCMP2878 / gene_product=hypothetical protein / transcript_product=hypothetical protein / location=Cvel_scaffold1622:25148-28481(+) / protein_length=397 / sequence_SO=supercontig / SO=protein_coding / is_pseudo=false